CALRSAFAANRPVVPVPSLLALAEQSNESRVIAALDARMGEAYLAAYARNGEDWDEVIAPRLTDGQSLPPLPGRDRQRIRPAPVASGGLSQFGGDALRRRPAARRGGREDRRATIRPRRR